MDYPAPRVGAGRRPRPISRDAYGVGVGRWDRFAVDWLYGARTDADGQARMAAALGRGPALRRRRRCPPGRRRPSARQPVGRRRRSGRRARADDAGPRRRDRPLRPGRAQSRRAAVAACAARSCRSGCSTATRSRRRRSCSAASISPMRVNGDGHGEARAGRARRAAPRARRPARTLSPAALTVPPALLAQPLGRLVGRQSTGRPRSRSCRPPAARSSIRSPPPRSARW